MNELGAGVIYSLWLRSRWAMAGLTAYLVVLAIVVQLSPAPMLIAGLGVLPPSALIAHLLTVFTLGPADLGARGSGFPKHMMVLPLRTRALAGWPMLIGATTIAAIWIVVTTCILWPGGLHVPLLWPAALAVAGTVWLQAIGWSPFPSPFVRVPALAVAMVPLVLVGACAGMFLESRVAAILIVVASIIWTIVAYWFGVQGLSRARAGSQGEWLYDSVASRFVRMRFPSAATVLPERFRTSFAAHLWAECRRNAILLPMMFSWMTIPVMFIVISSVLGTGSRDIFIIGSVGLTPSAFGLALLMGFIVMYCGMYGPGMGKFDIWGKDQIPAFFAIRPVSTPRYVAIKMTAAVIGGLAVWAMMFVLLAVWVLLETSSWNPRPSIVRAALANATPRDLGMIVAVPLGLIAFSFREMLTGMWAALAGRKWLSNVMGIAMVILLVVACGVGVWLHKHSERQPALMDWLPWLLGIALFVKLIVTARIVIAIRQYGILSTSTLLKWATAWLAACIGLFLLTTFFVTPSLTVAAGTMVMMPLARIAAAPLALHFNRHR
jgi:hypothetical protein